MNKTCLDCIFMIVDDDWEDGFRIGCRKDIWFLADDRIDLKSKLSLAYTCPSYTEGTKIYSDF